MPLTRNSSFEGGLVGTRINEYHLQGWRIVGTPPAGCKVDTSWFALEREIAGTNKNTLTIRDITVTKKRVIPVSGIRSEEFIQAIKDLKSCFLQVGVVLQRI